MPQPVCSSCGKPLEPGALFCSACGGKVGDKGKLCQKCGHSNDNQAQFCAACGYDLNDTEVAATANENNIHYINSAANAVDGENFSIFTKLAKFKKIFNLTGKARILFAIIASLIVIAIFSYYYYLTTLQKSYLGKCSKFADQISAANEMLGSNLNDNITADNIKTINKDIPIDKDNLQTANDTLLSLKCPQKYQSQQKKLAELGRLENTILQQVSLVLDNPLSSETDTVINNLRKNINNAKEISAQIQMSGVVIDFSGDILVVPDKLAVYCSDQRKTNTEKVERLNALNSFFDQMDKVIEENKGAKQDLGAMLGTIRDGGYSWDDYFNLINDARSTREDIRSELDNITTPKGTESLKEDFSNILSLSIQYCDLMESGANLEFNDDYDSAQDKYNQANDINKQVEDQFKTFLQNYQNEKNSLTGADS